MTHNEAVKTIREALRIAAMWIPDDSSGDTKALFKALAALDSLAAESKPLDPAIQTLVQENFWELAGKPAVEPGEDVTILVDRLNEIIWHDAEFDEDLNEAFLQVGIDKPKAIALITARDERTIRECRGRVESIYADVPGKRMSEYEQGYRHALIDAVDAIMGSNE